MRTHVIQEKRRRKNNSNDKFPITKIAKWRNLSKEKIKSLTIVPCRWEAFQTKWYQYTQNNENNHKKELPKTVNNNNNNIKKNVKYNIYIILSILWFIMLTIHVPTYTNQHKQHQQWNPTHQNHKYDKNKNKNPPKTNQNLHLSLKRPRDGQFIVSFLRKKKQLQQIPSFSNTTKSP